MNKQLDWIAVATLAVKVVGTVGGAALAAYSQSGSWQAALIAAAFAGVGLVQQAPQTAPLRTPYDTK